MAKLELGKISFGKTDAFNELIEFGPDYFLNSFVNNDKYMLPDFLNGNKCFICGKKGTGKTAFLRYLECTLDKPENLVIPIRFKSEFDELDKEQLISASKNSNQDDAADPKDLSFATRDIVSMKSYVLMWKAFLIDRIISEAKEKELPLFRDDENYRDLKVVLLGLFGEKKDRRIILPKVKKGTVELSAGLSAGLSANLKLELEFDPKGNRINYLKAAKAVARMFAKLQYNTGKVYVLVDELELSVRNQDSHNKDIMLVRDLILAIDALNHDCKVHWYDIHFIASIRSEVINSVISAGFEINKPIEDYGITIDWYQKGGDYLDNPLLKIIENKIHASEKLNSCEPTDSVWDSYFESPINNLEVRKYILNNSWYRPRDIIRLMTLLQAQTSEKEKFTQEMFDRAQQDYSNNMWNELSEELRLSYSSDDLEAILTFFYNIEIPFSYEYLQERKNKLGEIDPKVKSFFEKVSMADFVKKMFDLGVIGNSGQRMVFTFLKYKRISLLEPMVIHTPLRNFFAVHSRKR